MPLCVKHSCPLHQHVSCVPAWVLGKNRLFFIWHYQPDREAAHVPGSIYLLMKPSSVRAEVMNDRHRQAKRAQKECADLYLLLLMHRRGRLCSLW